MIGFVSARRAHFLFCAAIAVAAASPLCAQTTIGPGGKGNSGYLLQSNSWIGQSFTSPGGTLTSFSFTDTESGRGGATFGLANFTDGYISAPIFERAVALADGSTTINDIGFSTVAGQMYVAYVGAGPSTTSTPMFLGAIQLYFPANVYIGGSSYGFLDRAPNQTTDYGRRDDFDLAFTATFAPAAAAVPEPATWAMLLLGFGGMGYAMRRRARVSARVRFA